MLYLIENMSSGSGGDSTWIELTDKKNALENAESQKDDVYNRCMDPLRESQEECLSRRIKRNNSICP